MGALVWSEFEPRLGLLQGLLQGRRVLEVGTQDARSLLRLVELGASSVVGTHPEPAKVGHKDALPRSVDLLSMDTGRLDFEDDRFDAVVVADLARAQSTNGRFLRELRRILAPDGLGLLVFEAEGASWSGLVDDPARLSSPEKLIRQIEQAFPQPRIFAQTPFAGIAIRPQDEAPFSGGISLDPRREPDPPSHLLALVGQVAPEGREHTLVEVGFAQVREQNDRIKARADADRERLAGALGRVQRALSKRDATLEEIQRRLPRIRAALHERSALPAPTILEREVDEAEPLRARIRSLEAELEEARSAPPSSWYGSSIESTRWEEAPSAEPDARERGPNGEAMRQELEQLRTEWSDAHRRAQQLEERLVEQSSAHELRLAGERAEREKLVERLGRAERERDALQQALDEQEDRPETEQQLRQMAESYRWEQARLQRALEEAHAEIQMLSAKNLSLVEASKASEESERSRDGDRLALELTASHLAQEVETLRGRNQALREERDALARTSELLLEERDQATTSAHEARAAAGDLERRMELQAHSLEQSEAARRESEAALAKAEEARAAEAAARSEERERAERAEAELKARLTKLEGELETAAQQLRELDAKAGYEAEVAQAREEAEALVRALEAQVVDALRATAEAQQERQTIEERLAVIEQSRFDLEQQLASALSEKARAEADAVQARTDRQVRATEGLRSDAELVRLRAELGRRLAQVRQLRAERDEAIAGRDVAQGEAARLSLLPPVPSAGPEDADPLPGLRLERLRARFDAVQAALETEREARAMAEQARDRVAAALDRQVEARWALEEEVEALRARSFFAVSAAAEGAPPAPDPELEEGLRSLQGELEASERQRGAWESLAQQLEAATTAREEELSVLRRDVGQAFDERTQAQQEKVELERLRDELEGALKVSREESAQLRSELESAWQRRSEAEEAAESAQSVVDELRNQLSEAEAEASRLEQAAQARAAEQDDELARVRSQAEAEAQAARERADELSARLEAASDERSRDLATLEEMRAKAEAADQELSSAVMALEEAQTSLAERNAEVERLQRRVAQLDAELVEAERTAAEEKHSREQIAEQLEQEAQRSRDLESAQGGERLAKTMSDLGEAKARLERLGRDVESLRDEEGRLRERAERAESELQRAEGETSRLNEALRKARQDEAQVQGQLSTLSQELQEAKAARNQAESRARTRAEELEAQIDRIAGEKEELVSALEREKARAQQLAQEEEQQRRQALELAQRLERLERSRPEDPLSMDAVKESADLQRQLDEARGELGRRLTELKTARRALESEQDKREQAEQRVAQAERVTPSAPPQGMRRAIELRDQEIGRLRSELEGLSAERDRLRGGIQDSEGEQLRLERRVAQLEASLDDHQRRVEQLRRELQEKTEQLRRLSR